MGPVRDREQYRPVWALKPLAVLALLLLGASLAFGSGALDSNPQPEGQAARDAADVARAEPVEHLDPPEQFPLVRASYGAAAGWNAYVLEANVTSYKASEFTLEPETRTLVLQVDPPEEVWGALLVEGFGQEQEEDLFLLTEPGLHLLMVDGNGTHHNSITLHPHASAVSFLDDREGCPVAVTMDEGSAVEQTSPYLGVADANTPLQIEYLPAASCPTGAFRTVFEGLWGM